MCSLPGKTLGFLNKKFLYKNTQEEIQHFFQQVLQLHKIIISRSVIITMNKVSLVCIYTHVHMHTYIKITFCSVYFCSHMQDLQFVSLFLWLHLKCAVSTPPYWDNSLFAVLNIKHYILFFSWHSFFGLFSNNNKQTTEHTTLRREKVPVVIGMKKEELSENCQPSCQQEYKNVHDI